MRWVSATAIAGFGLVVLAACTLQEEPTSTPAVDSSGLWVAQFPWMVSGAALVEGTLERSETGCYGIRMGTDDYAEFVPVQFPAGTNLVEGGIAIDLPDVGRVEIGDLVSGGGSYRTPEPTEVLDGYPDECPSGQVAYLGG